MDFINLVLNFTKVSSTCKLLAGPMTYFYQANFSEFNLSLDRNTVFLHC